jgi:hypothetical protein
LGGIIWDIPAKNRMKLIDNDPQASVPGRLGKIDKSSEGHDGN